MGRAVHPKNTVERSLMQNQILSATTQTGEYRRDSLVVTAIASSNGLIAGVKQSQIGEQAWLFIN